MMKKTLLSCLGLVCLFQTTSFAQTHLIDLNIQGGVSLEQFSEVTKGLGGIGFGGSALFNIEDSPFYLGGSLGYMIYGKTSFGSQEAFVDGYWYDADIVFNNNIVHGHVVSRIRPKDLADRFITPYFDLMFGFKSIYTKQKVFVPDLQDDEEFDFWDDLLFPVAYETEIVLSSWTLSYGGAVGVNFNFGGESGEEIALDLKVVYLEGTRAEYVTHDDIEYDSFNDQYLYNTRSSRTSMFMPQIGITYILY